MKLTVVVKEPNKSAVRRTVQVKESILDTVQKLVGGGKNAYVEQVGIGPGVTILVDEDGLAKDLPDNCGYVGNLVFVQDVFISDEEGYDWGSLDENNVRKVLAWCVRHAKDVQPNKDRRPHIMTDPKQIEEHRRRLKADAQAKLVEWESL
jgi:hypothetical protein